MPLSYKDHTIVAAAARSQAQGNFIPVIHIAWKIAGESGTHSIVSRDRFPTSDEATDYAAAQAKAWIDRHAEESD